MDVSIGDPPGEPGGVLKETRDPNVYSLASTSGAAYSFLFLSMTHRYTVAVTVDGTDVRAVSMGNRLLPTAPEIPVSAEIPIIGNPCPSMARMVVKDEDGRYKSVNVRHDPKHLTN
jgi:hypothetical protein